MLINEPGGSWHALKKILVTGTIHAQRSRGIASRGLLLLQRSARWQRVRIVKSARTKTCVDGSLTKEYLPDEPLTGIFLNFLERFGTVRLLEQLKRPYFSFEKDHFISIRGFIGDPRVEVRYRKEFQDREADNYHLLLYYERQGEAGIARLQGMEGSLREKMKIRLGPSDRHNP